MIETLEDIVEELANNLGIYGTHGELHPDGQCECRVCFSIDLKARISQAVEIENRLAGTTPGELQSRVDCLAMFARRMLRVMRLNALGDREVCQQADRYLKAIGATGSILRNEDIQEQS